MVQTLHEAPAVSSCGSRNMRRRRRKRGGGGGGEGVGGGRGRGGRGRGVGGGGEGMEGRRDRETGWLNEGSEF